MNKSGNPALKASALDRVRAIEQTEHATIGGTIFKTVVLFLLLVGGAAYGWQLASSNSASIIWIMFGSMIAATIFAFITIFAPKASPFTAPIYAILEGVVLGVISQYFNQAYGDIVLQAVLLTGTVFTAVLLLYTTGIVKVTAKLRAVILIATLGIALYYLASFIFSLFGGSLPLIYDTGTFGIVLSVIVVIIAALNLLLDFDFIERTANQKAPKVFEWYGAFGLMVTLVWLYLEILRLLAKSRS